MRQQMVDRVPVAIPSDYRTLEKAGGRPMMQIPDVGIATAHQLPETVRWSVRGA
jgi:hypothetical protein